MCTFTYQTMPLLADSVEVPSNGQEPLLLILTGSLGEGGVALTIRAGVHCPVLLTCPGLSIIWSFKISIKKHLYIMIFQFSKIPMKNKSTQLIIRKTKIFKICVTTGGKKSSKNIFFLNRGITDKSFRQIRENFGIGR